MRRQSWTIGVALGAWAAVVLALTLVSYARVRALHARGAERQDADASDADDADAPAAAAAALAGMMTGARVRVKRVDVNAARAQLDLTDPTTRSVHAAATTGHAVAWMVDGAWWGVGRAGLDADDGWVRMGPPPDRVASSWPIAGRGGGAALPPAGEWHVFVFHRV